MKRLKEILARLGEIDTELAELTELEERSEDGIDDDDAARITELIEEAEALRAEAEPIRDRQEKLARMRDMLDSGRAVVESGDGARAPIFAGAKTEPDEIRRDELYRYPREEVRSAAMRTLERALNEQVTPVSDDVATHLERLMRTNTSNLDGRLIAERLILTENEDYRNAWMKAVTQPVPMFLPDEVRAMQAFRAGPQSLTAASGGYGVPVLIDPTIILTTGASDVPLLRVARIETITTNVWKGVSSAPAAWSGDAEGGTVSDDSISMAQPTVTPGKAQAFVPFTIEVGQDYPGFAAEMARVISAGYLQYLASSMATGAGTNDAPIGIFTAIDAAAAQEVLATTSGSLAPQDALTAWNKLGELYRSRATWFSSVSVESQIRNAGTNNSLFSVNLTAEGLSVVNGRPWYTSDYAPAFTGTTGTVNLLVVGDFSNYLVAQRAGMNIELVPHLVDVTNNRPTGQRGWYAWARVGADSINDAGFVLLKNTT